MTKFVLDLFESIGVKYANIMAERLDIHNVDDFLRYPVEYISNKTGIELNRVQKWTEIIRLFRIPTVSIRDAELLSVAQINSIEELAHSQGIRILYKFDKIDIETTQIILKKPTLNKIENWINYAKLMVKNPKYDLDIPLIMFPMITINYSSNFIKYNIITLQDLEDRIIPNVRKRIGMTISEYRWFLDLVDLVSIDGINLPMASVLYNAGIKNSKDLMVLDSHEILNMLKTVKNPELKSILDEMTSQWLEEIKNEFKDRPNLLAVI